MSHSRRIKCKCGQVLAINSAAECLVTCPSCQTRLKVPAAAGAAKSPALRPAQPQRAQGKGPAKPKPVSQPAVQPQQQPIDPLAGGFGDLSQLPSSPSPAAPQRTFQGPGARGKAKPGKQKLANNKVLLGGIGIAVAVVLGIVVFALLPDGSDQDVAQADSSGSRSASGTADLAKAPEQTTQVSGELSDTEQLTEFDRNPMQQTIVLSPSADWQPLPKGRVEFAEGSRTILAPVVLDRAKNLVAASVITDKTTKVWSGDLASGQSKLLLEHPTPLRLLDHHPGSGQSLIWQDLDVLSSGGSLRIVTGLSDAKPVDVFKQELPGNSKSGFHLSVKWARVIDANTFAAVMGEDFYLWNHDNKLLLKAEVGRKDVPMLDSQRRYLALPQAGGAAMVDLQSKRQIGFLPFTSDDRPVVSFHPDGKRFVMYSRKQMRIWDLSTNKFEDSSMPYGLNANVPHWVDANIYLNGNSLCRIGDSTAAWQYSLTSLVPGPSYQGGMLVGDSDSVTFVQTLPIPNAAANSGIAAMEGGSADDMDMAPGSQVQLVVTAVDPIDPAEMRVVGSELISNAQWVESPSAAAKLEIKVAKGKTQKLEYKMLMGADKGSKFVDVQLNTTSLVLTIDGEKVWEYDYTNLPRSVVQAKAGESFQEAVNEATKPDLKSLKLLELPTYLPKKKLRYGRGSSTLRNGDWKDTPYNL